MPWKNRLDYMIIDNEHGTFEGEGALLKQLEVRT